MPRRKVSNPLALAVLALLRERPMHPYEMATMLKERDKDESIKLNYGSLYTVVDALVREEYIVPLETVREGRRPERTVYGLTDRGAEELGEWLSELLRAPVKEYPSFAAGLSLIMVLPPGQAVALLAERAQRLEERLATAAERLEDALSQEVPRLVLIESEYEQALLQAELAFVRGLVEEIEQGTLDGLDWWNAYHAGAAQGGAREGAGP